MSTGFLIVFCICVEVPIFVTLFFLAQIATRLYSIHIDLCHIHEDLVRFYAKGKVDKMGGNPIVLFNENPPKKKDRTEATKRYNRTHRLVLDRKLGKHRWVKKSECHRELNLATGKEIWVANA